MNQKDGNDHIDGNAESSDAGRKSENEGKPAQEFREDS